MARVAVIGGGYGGVTVAKGLDPLADVILIEQKDQFVHHAAALRAAVDTVWEHAIFMPYTNLLTANNSTARHPPGVHGAAARPDSRGTLRGCPVAASSLQIRTRGRTVWFGPSPHARARRLVSVIDFDEVVVLVFVLIVVVILVNLIEDVEGEFHAQLGEEDIVVGEEGVAQRQLGGFERGVVGLVSIACDVEVVLECVEQARQRAAGISGHGT